MNDLLKTIYYDVAHPAGYGTVDKLWVATKRRYDKKDIDLWLQAQEAHTLHKPRRLKFQRSRYYVPNMNNLFQADLCDMRSLKRYNDKVAYILTVIDVFCKKAWAVPLRNKEAQSVVDALKKVFGDRKPSFLQSDKGKEFVAGKVQTFLKKQNNKFYTSQNPDTKCSVVERFNRTLKTKMWKYFTYAGTYTYIDVLQDLVDAYNNTKHSAIGMAPNDVHSGNQQRVYRALYSGEGRYGKLQQPQGGKLVVGDRVRITRDKYLFEKGYASNWSTELFVVAKILRADPVRYEIQDLQGEDIKGSFYAQELQRVETSADTAYKIDKILASRGKGVSREVLVKWQGYGTKFNSWVLASTLQT